MIRRAFVAAILLVGACLCAAAQNYPARPVKLITPYTPGSPNDVLARLVMQHLSTRLGQPVVIENRPGGGTVLGTRAAAAAEPDGYTLLIGATSFVLAPSLYGNAGYDPIRQFAPVALLVAAPQVLVVTSALPAKSVAEFVAYARANPGTLNFGFGQGTLPQILGESFKTIAGIDVLSVPYKGGANAMTDMLGGRIHMIFGTISTLLPLIRDGKIRALAVTTGARSPHLPDVPTMLESGLPQMSLVFSAGILAPAGTPPAIVDQLNRAINATLQSPEVRASLDKLGFEPTPGSPADYAAFLADELRRWPAIVKASGVKGE